MLFRKFIRELPWLVAIWIVGSLGFFIWNSLVEAEPMDESLKIALVFLPILIPLAPITWLRYERQARTPRAMPAIGLGCAWMVVGTPVAIGLSVLIGKLLNFF